jgi:hypothetical protein
LKFGRHDLTSPRLLSVHLTWRALAGACRPDRQSQPVEKFASQLKTLVREFRAYAASASRDESWRLLTV